MSCSTFVKQVPLLHYLGYSLPPANEVWGEVVFTGRREGGLPSVKYDVHKCPSKIL